MLVLTEAAAEVDPEGKAHFSLGMQGPSQV